MASSGRTGLTDQNYVTALKAICEHFVTRDRITNLQLRSVTNLNYDQAIKVFNRAISSSGLERRGKSGGTHYVVGKMWASLVAEASRMDEAGNSSL